MKNKTIITANVEPIEVYRTDEIEFTKGSNNIFADLELKNPETLLMKSTLAVLLDKAIKAGKYSPKKAAALTGFDANKLKEIRRGAYRQVSVFRLMRALAAVGQNIEVRVSPAGKGKSGIVSVID